MIVVMLGLAGSGKTSLTAAYASWTRSEGLNVGIVNLDPGVKKLPYVPDFDVREWFTVEDIMVKEGLGPNGAFIRASQLLASRADEIVSMPVFKDELKDLIIVDTPGQMEIFVYRRSGPEVIAKLDSIDRVVGVFIIDGEMMKNPLDLALARLQGLIVELRLNIPVVPVVNKLDLIPRNSKLLKAIEDPELLLSELEMLGEGLLTEVGGSVVDIITRVSRSVRLVAVSARNRENIDELHRLVHEAFCVCGDLS